jgi:hypothetical protein
VYCHFCSGKLKPIQVSDCFLQGFVCEDGHLISSVIGKYSQDEYRNARNVVVNKTTREKVLREWLGNPEFRVKPPDQLCELLRAELDLMNGKLLNQVVSVFHYCPTCGETLNYKDSNDVWVNLSECKNGHTWWMRNEIWSTDQKVRQKLDITHQEYLSLKRFYKEDEEHGKCMPEQIWALI